MIVFRTESVRPKDNPLVHLQELGFSLINQKPIDFTLPKIKGGEGKLSNYKGNWIWMVFWATWCGPCLYELPTLESLHLEYGDQDFKVIGVSIDQGPKSTVIKFLKKINISFPVFHDQNSRISSKYMASSVPTIYVISPDWRLVGVFRGANNWDTQRTVQTVKGLITHKETLKFLNQIDPNVKNVDKIDKTNQQGLTLPNDLIPPSMEIVPFDPGKNFVNGEKFNLEVGIKWPGDPKKYLIKVPKITLPQGIKLLTVSSASINSGNESNLSYSFLLLPKKSGKYSLGPIELVYKPRLGGKEQYSRLNGLEITVLDSFIKRFWYWLVLGILAIIFSSIFFIYYRKKIYSKSSRGDQKSLEHSKWRNQFDQIRTHKVKSNKQVYTIKLLNFYILFQKNYNQQTDLSKEEGQLESIRYAGLELKSEEIASYEKSIERSLKKTAPEEEILD